MKTLIIPDIHVKLSIVRDVLKKYESKVDQVIFLGDYFDDFNDSAQSNAEMAMWLKESLRNEKHIHLCGNHEMGYRYTDTKETRCSGWSPDKMICINNYLMREDWDKLKYFHYDKENDFWFSHAGMSGRIFAHPVHGFVEERITKQIRKAEQEVYLHGIIPIEFGAGISRGGYQSHGGLIWLDFAHEFEPVPGINQIFGHTPDHKPRMVKGQESVNFCLDTNLMHVFILENKKLDRVDLTWWQNKA